MNVGVSGYSGGRSRDGGAAGQGAAAGSCTVTNAPWVAGIQLFQGNQCVVRKTRPDSNIARGWQWLRWHAGAIEALQSPVEGGVGVTAVAMASTHQVDLG